MRGRYEPGFAPSSQRSANALLAGGSAPRRATQGANRVTGFALFVARSAGTQTRLTGQSGQGVACDAALASHRVRYSGVA
jgi:hypothetical protein